MRDRNSSQQAFFKTKFVIWDGKNLLKLSRQVNRWNFMNFFYLAKSFRTELLSWFAIGSSIQSYGESSDRQWMERSNPLSGQSKSPCYSERNVDKISIKRIHNHSLQALLAEGEKRFRYYTWSPMLFESNFQKLLFLVWLFFCFGSYAAAIWIIVCLKVFALIFTFTIIRSCFHAI